MNISELKSILCHEMGHYKKGHIYKMLMTSLLIQAIGLYIFSLMIDWQPMYTAFGFAESAGGQAAIGRHPLIGCLKGLITVAPGTDLTEPADPEWAEMLDDNELQQQSHGI